MYVRSAGNEVEKTLNAPRARERYSGAQSQSVQIYRFVYKCHCI